MTEAELKTAIEILPDRLYYVSLRSKPHEETTRNAHFFTMDSELVYWNFFLDFGPLNLAQLYRFCQRLNTKLKSEALRDKVIYYYCGSHAHKRTNAAYLMCAWSLLYLDRTPEEAFRPFRGMYPPFPPFHDASPCACTFNLSILDCLKGLAKARYYKFFDFANFNAEEYEHFEQVENGDLNWILNGKFLAFAGPHNSRELSPEGYYTLTPEDYTAYFLKNNVQLVVRLNKKYYDEQKFKDMGINHMELYYLDGSIPTTRILQTFLEACEATPGAVAVHCKAGLGRTGTCIGCYIMKHYRFTAAEAIGWIRICRPGSIIGPQQHYLKEMEQTMWHQGDLYRQQQQQQALVPRREGLRSNSLTGGSAAIGATSSTSSSSSGKAPLPPKQQQGLRLGEHQKEGSGSSSNHKLVDRVSTDLGGINLAATGSGELLSRASALSSNNKLGGRTGSSSSVTSAAHSATQGDSLLHRRAMMSVEQHRKAGGPTSSSGRK